MSFKSPEHIGASHARGVADALAQFGFKRAAEEIRLKIPRREFHGWDEAFKGRNTKKANGGNEGTADTLEKMLEQLGSPNSPNTMIASKDPLDRSTAWGAPSSLAAGDAGSRMSDMGQNTGFGGV